MIARLCSDFKGFLQGVTCSPKELKHNLYLMRERQTDRQTDRQTETDRQRYRERQRQRDTETERRERETHTHRDRERHRERERQRQRHRDRGEGRGREGGRETTYWVHQSLPEQNPNGMLSEKVVLKENWSLITVVANHGSLL